MKPVMRLSLGCASLCLACASQPKPMRIPLPINKQSDVVHEAPALNDLSADEQRAGWRLLFDGRTFNGWRGLGYDTVPTAHWMIENGAIRKIPDAQVPRQADGQPAVGGDLMTRDTFRDFELSWEWKISRAGNSGVKYNVSE